MELHEACKARLIEKLAEVLREVTVTNGKFVDRTSEVIRKLVTAESILPQTGSVRNLLHASISETPLTDFVLETLSRELFETQQYDDTASKAPLVTVSGYEDSVTVARRLVAEIASLPWEYSFTVKISPNLASHFMPAGNTIALSSTLSIIRPDEEFIHQFPLDSGIQARDESLRTWTGMLSFLEKGFKWDPEATYLQFRCHGFVGKYGETGPSIAAISFLKSFCGLAVALRFLDVSVNSHSSFPRHPMFVHRHRDNSWEVIRHLEIDSELSDGISKLALDDLNGYLVTEEDWKRRFQTVLGQFNMVYGHLDKSSKVLLASRWLFESRCSKNDLLSFVQLTVVLEILLGDKSVSDIIGLGELLRNRCAYLIGKSSQQREAILKDFRDIYDVRSHIVHRGKSQLSNNERGMKSRLEWMCSRVIQEECRLLEGDIKKA